MRRFPWTGSVCMALAVALLLAYAAPVLAAPASREQMQEFDRALELRQEGAYAEAKRILSGFKDEGVLFGPERDLAAEIAKTEEALIRFFRAQEEADRRAARPAAHLIRGTEAARQRLADRQARAQEHERAGRLDEATQIYMEAAREYLETRLRDGLELVERGYYEDARRIFREADERRERHGIEVSDALLAQMEGSLAEMPVLEANQREALLLLAARGEAPAYVPGRELEQGLFNEYLSKARAALDREDAGAAREWLGLAAARPVERLEEDEKAELTGLWARLTTMEKEQREEKARRLAEMAKEEQQLQRALQFHEEVIKMQQVREQRARATAQDQYELAEKAYGSLQLEEALHWAEKALRTYPDHEAAAELRRRIQSAMGIAPRLPEFARTVSEWERVRKEMAEAQLVANRQQANQLQAQGEYEQALNFYTEALTLAEWLGPDFEGQARALRTRIEEARELVSRQREREERERRLEAEREARRHRELADMVELRERAQFLRMAYDEYTRGNYAAAIQLCETIDQIDPGNQAARELRRNAIQAQRTRDWQVLEMEQREARRREVLSLKEKLLWQDAIIKYPSRDVWRGIVDRGPVPMPTGEAVKTPADLDLELALERLLPFEFVGAPLQEVIETFALMVEKNIILDERAVLVDERLVTMTVRDPIPLRSALNLVLGEDMGYIIKDGAILVSTRERLRLLEPQDFRIYDIRDLTQSPSRIRLGATDTTTDTTTGTTGTTTTGTTDTTTDTRRSGSQDIVGLIFQLTGPENWRAVQIVGGGEAEDTTDTGFGLPGTGDDDPFGFDDFEPGVERGGGTIVLREPGDLLVTQTDRIHMEIERILTHLRDLIDVVIVVEARIINFTDDFYREVGTNWAEITWKNSKFDLGLFKFPKVDWRIDAIAPAAGVPSGDLDILPDFTIEARFLDYDGLSAFMRAVKASHFAQVMQAPSITLINTMEGSIDVTRNVAYVASYATGPDQLPAPTIATFSTGVSLNVIAVVSADRRYVELDMDPNVSSGHLETFSFSTTQVGVENGVTTPTIVTSTIQQPVEDVVTVDTVVRVPDRGSVIMGGLSRVADYRRETGLPFLSHIPFIKRLFTKVGEFEERKRLLMTVTPTILIQEEMEALIPH